MSWVVIEIRLVTSSKVTFPDEFSNSHLFEIDLLNDDIGRQEKLSGQNSGIIVQEGPFVPNSATALGLTASS